MNQTLLLPLLPLVGVIIGAALQSILQSKREQRTQKRILKVKAYSDYLQACARLASKDVEKHSEAKIFLADAKARIAIYGTQNVIANIAEFDRKGARLDTQESMELFLKITLSMREEDQNQKIKREDMARLLFGVDIP
jgi:hypothetical protein